MYVYSFHSPTKRRHRSSSYIILYREGFRDLWWPMKSVRINWEWCHVASYYGAIQPLVRYFGEQVPNCPVPFGTLNHLLIWFRLSSFPLQFLLDLWIFLIFHSEVTLTFSKFPPKDRQTFTVSVSFGTLFREHANNSENQQQKFKKLSPHIRKIFTYSVKFF